MWTELNSQQPDVSPEWHRVSVWTRFGMGSNVARVDKPEAVTVAVARWVAEARTEHGIPLNQLATRVFIPRNTLRRLIDGDPKGFTVPQLGRIAAVFGVELSDITRAAEEEAAAA